MMISLSVFFEENGSNNEFGVCGGRRVKRGFEVVFIELPRGLRRGRSSLAGVAVVAEFFRRRSTTSQLDDDLGNSESYYYLQTTRSELGGNRCEVHTLP